MGDIHKMQGKTGPLACPESLIWKGGNLCKKKSQIALFLAGSLCMAEPASIYFKWRCLGLIPGFYFIFIFSPFFGGLPKVNTRILLLLLLFSPLTDSPTQAITFLKIKNMMNLVKQCKCASL